MSDFSANANRPPSQPLPTQGPEQLPPPQVTPPITRPLLSPRRSNQPASYTEFVRAAPRAGAARRTPAPENTADAPPATLETPAPREPRVARAVGALSTVAAQKGRGSALPPKPKPASGKPARQTPPEQPPTPPKASAGGGSRGNVPPDGPRPPKGAVPGDPDDEDNKREPGAPPPPDQINTAEKPMPSHETVRRVVNAVVDTAGVGQHRLVLAAAVAEDPDHKWTTADLRNELNKRQGSSVEWEFPKGATGMTGHYGEAFSRTGLVRATTDATGRRLIQANPEVAEAAYATGGALMEWQLDNPELPLQ